MKIVQMSAKRGISLESSVPKVQLVKAFGACQWWLSKDWLNQKKIKHPMQYLWQNSGWASDVELFMIGNTILKLRQQGTKKAAFEGKKKEFLGKQSANYMGYLFELLVSSLFIEGGNKVSLLPPSAKGYDLDIQTLNGTQIQVSCKVCQPSQKYNDFLQKTNSLRDNFKHVSEQLKIKGAFISADINDAETNFPLKKEIKDGLILSLKNPGYLMHNNNYYMFGKIPPPSYAKGFSIHLPSYSFAAFSKIDKNYELNRIKTIINKANKGFKQLTVNNKVNLTVVRIPQYISIESVKKYIEAEFKKGVFTSTSAVLLLQTHIVNNSINNNTNEVRINTAFQLVYNPNSTVLWPFNEELHLVQALGSVSTSTPPIQLMNQILEEDMYINTDYLEGVVVPLGTSIGGSNLAGVRRIVEWEGTNFGIEMFPIPTELQLL